MKARWCHGDMWAGIKLSAWLRLLGRNYFAVSPRRAHTVVWLTGMALLNSLLGLLQRLRYGRSARRIDLPDDPLFIIGHWRTGTTMLHELFALDKQMRCPLGYESFAPNHFLLTQSLVRRWFPFVLPKTRHFDNVKIGFDCPQEDEVALCLMGSPSPFFTFAFPGRGLRDPAYADLESLSPRRLQQWQRRLRYFLQLLLLRRPGRLVLKSPQHTFRLPELLNMFPAARFVHVVRDPYAVYPSTVHFWKSMIEAYGLRRASDDWIKQHVLDMFVAMEARLEQTRPLIDPRKFCEVRYEQLVADPVATMQSIYAQLALDGFAAVRHRVQRYAQASQRYQTNHYQLSEADRQLVSQTWGDAIRHYGYDQPADEGAKP